jgi:hypothetical protein
MSKMSITSVPAPGPSITSSFKNCGTIKYYVIRHSKSIVLRAVLVSLVAQV